MTNRRTNKSKRTGDGNGVAMNHHITGQVFDHTGRGSYLCSQNVTSRPDGYVPQHTLQENYVPVRSNEVPVDTSLSYTPVVPKLF